MNRCTKKIRSSLIFFVQRFKPDFFGIEQGVCNKKMVKNRVKLSLPLFFGLFPKNKPYSSRISLIPGEFRPILVEKVSTLWLLFNGEK